MVECPDAGSSLGRCQERDEVVLPTIPCDPDEQLNGIEGRERAEVLRREEAEEGLLSRLDALEESLRGGDDAREWVGLQEGPPLLLAFVAQALENKVQVFDEEKECLASEPVDQDRFESLEDLRRGAIEEVFQPVPGKLGRVFLGQKFIDALQQLHERCDRLVLEQPGDTDLVQVRGVSRDPVVQKRDQVRLADPARADQQDLMLVAGDGALSRTRSTILASIAWRWTNISSSTWGSVRLGVNRQMKSLPAMCQSPLSSAHQR